MSFTYDISTNVGQVRFELGDDTEDSGVKPDGSNLSDEEINILLTREDSTVMRAVAAACEALARMYARFVDLSVGPRREALNQASAAYAERAKELRDEYGGGGGVSRKATSGGIVKVDGFNAGMDYASDSVLQAAGESEYAPVAITVYLDY